MYRDFIIKQTSDFDSEFKPRTLIGNWFEERCNPDSKPDNFHFAKDHTTPSNPASTYELIVDQSSSNWLSFQKFEPNQTFNTEYRQSFKEGEDQKRLSVLNPFITKKGEFEKNESALNEYREKWTKSQNVYDQSRTSIGHAKK